MRISIGAPQAGALATLDAVAAVAAVADTLDIDGVWVIDRLLKPVHPRDPYPAAPDGVLSRQFDRALDPLTVLTYLAAGTQRVRLGTGVLVAPLYPVLLARSLTSLDVLSGGRVDLGLGVGWSGDEYEAAGVAGGGLGARMDEVLEVLERAWTDDIVEHHGPTLLQLQAATTDIEV